MHDGALGNDQRPRQRDALDDRAHDLPRKQAALGVVDDGTDIHGSRVVTDTRSDELDFGVVAERPATDVGDPDAHALPLRTRERGAQTVRLGFRDREVYVQLVRLDDASQQARVAPGGDQTALRARLTTGETADGRSHLGIREVEIGPAQGSLAPGHGRCGTLEGRQRDIPVMHAGQLLIVDLQDPIALAACLREVRLLDGQVGPGAGHVRLESRGVDAKQQIIGVNAGAFVVRPLEKNAGDLRSHLDLPDTAQLRGVLERELHRTRSYLDRADLRRGERGRGGRARACAESDVSARQNEDSADTADECLHLGAVCTCRGRGRQCRLRERRAESPSREG